MTARLDRIFVYGTLQRGFRLHGYLRKTKARLLGKGHIKARLFDLGEFPGAFPSQSPHDFVEGELYELDGNADQLKLLDEIEEFLPENPQESLFIRKITVVRLRSGKQLKAWAYFLPRPPKNGRRIHAGRYKAA
jgi:gamma-glutamylcyclotransferase (GGCT)/AIG2-like uncharacterized protein YtfP